MQGDRPDHDGQILRSRGARLAGRGAAVGRAAIERAADWVFHAGDEALFAALADGRHAGNLREYFGAAEYAELAPLAALAKTAAVCPRPRVLIVPGIMASKLADAAPRRRVPRVLWIDPARLSAGGLLALALPAGRGLRPCGVLPYSYAKLALQLRTRGYRTGFHAYDWRLALEESGRALALRIASLGEPVSLIGHSMGGLVARAAVGMLPRRCVKRLIMLGTPNFGSFAPLQAMRGTYPFVRKIAQLDPAHTPEFLARRVFATFPGLCQLLPDARRCAKTDYFTVRDWPRSGPRPHADLLRRAAAARAALAAGDSRMRQIIGVDRNTIVGARKKKRGGFEYAIGPNGDGTVPRARALLPDCPAYYVEEWHSQLANNRDVIRAVADLLRGGRTRALPQAWPLRRTPLEHIDDARLRGADEPKIDWRRLDGRRRKALLAQLLR
ncbi:MAG TPA: hypothetical protein VMV25_06130 [Steroidobacteraceae bacterium]|nr:hypothetical protein [Steroidobacteraceae bacterium]